MFVHIGGKEFSVIKLILRRLQKLDIVRNRIEFEQNRITCMLGCCKIKVFDVTHLLFSSDKT